MTALPEVRHRVFTRFCEELPRGVALELEHCLYCLSVNNDVPYATEVHRQLFLLEGTKDYKTQLAKSGVASTVALGRRRHAAVDPAHASTGEAQQRARLSQIAERNKLSLPDAGTRCAKCKSSDIKFDFLQTRSADEPTTVFCCCERCGKRWRV